jgi:hypothetical protein
LVDGWQFVENVYFEGDFLEKIYSYTAKIIPATYSKLALNTQSRGVAHLRTIFNERNCQFKEHKCKMSGDCAEGS